MTDYVVYNGSEVLKFHTEAEAREAMETRPKAYMEVYGNPTPTRCDFSQLLGLWWQ